MTDDQTPLARLAATLRSMDPVERANYLAELAPVDPEQAQWLMQWLDQDASGSGAAMAANLPTENTVGQNRGHKDDAGFEDYLRRRAALIEQVWCGRKLGAYRVESVLGQGGMGLVLGAVDDTTGQEVAIKLVRPDLIGPGLDARLKRESEAMARLQHPGITQLMGLGKTIEGRPFLVMERVTGLPLDAAAVPMDLRERIQLLVKVCAIVAHAHTHQVVHRDLKPSNILVNADGVVRLLDFGIAKCLSDEAQSTRTLTAERMLTPRYAAPEQVRGETSGPPADVHAIGVMLVDLVSAAEASPSRAGPGRDPGTPGSEQPGSDRTGSDPTGHERWSAESLVAMPGSIRDPDLRAIAEVALASKSDDRYADAGRLGEDLERWLQGRPPRVRQWRSRLRRQWRAHSARGFSLIAAVLVLACAAAISWHQWVFLEQPVENGYGLVERDLVGLTGSQKTSVRKAFRLDADGDRDSALGLMQVVADGNAEHVLPAVMMSIWLGSRGEASADRYRLRVQTLLARGGQPYLALFHDAYSRDDDPDFQRRTLESALALRPSAWKLRFALAHGALGQNDARRARAEFAQIHFADFDDRRVPQILADRAMLGDCTEVRPLIPKLPADRPSWRTWVEAACAFSEGDHAVAETLFNQILEDPKADRQAATLDVVRSARLVTLGQGSNWSELLDAAAEGYRRAQSQNDRYSAHRDAIMALVAAHQLGLGADTEIWRERALSVEELQYQVDAHVAVRLLGYPSRFPVPALRADVAARMTRFPGLSLLIEAIEHRQSGRFEAAVSALGRARREGLGETRFAPVLSGLERNLGQDQAGTAVMLWFAPWSDWVAAWTLSGPAMTPERSSIDE